MKQIALQKITVRVFVAKTKIRIVKALVGVADLPAERQKNVPILIERDKFDRIPKIVALRRIRQKTPILFITGKRIQWARKRSRFFLSCHSIHPYNDHKQYQHLRDPERCLHSALTCLQKWLAFFAATRASASLTSRATAPPEYCCRPVIKLPSRRRVDR